MLGLFKSKVHTIISTLLNLLNLSIFSSRGNISTLYKNIRKTCNVPIDPTPMLFYQLGSVIF